MSDHKIARDFTDLMLYYTDEREAIERWLKDHNTDPRTNLKIKTKTLIPNHGLRNTIEEFLSG